MAGTPHLASKFDTETLRRREETQNHVERKFRHNRSPCAGCLGGWFELEQSHRGVAEKGFHVVAAQIPLTSFTDLRTRNFYSLICWLAFGRTKQNADRSAQKIDEESNCDRDSDGSFKDAAPKEIDEISQHLRGNETNSKSPSPRAPAKPTDSGECQRPSEQRKT